MPSLWNESFGLVAVEAMLNGIPVLASNRGALPETIMGSEQGAGSGEQERRREEEEGEKESKPGDSRLTFRCAYTPETRDVPTAEEVAPWVEAIIRLWDDADYYEHCSRAVRERALAWHPDRLSALVPRLLPRHRLPAGCAARVSDECRGALGPNRPIAASDSLRSS